MQKGLDHQTVLPSHRPPRFFKGGKFCNFPYFSAQKAAGKHPKKMQFPLLLFLAIVRVAQEPNRNRKPEPSEPFFPKRKVEPEPPEPFSRNRNWNRNRPFLLNCTETQKEPFCRGTAGTENRNRLNPQTVTEPNRATLGFFFGIPLTTHTPQIWGVAFSPPTFQGWVFESAVKEVFFDNPPPKFRGQILPQVLG